MQGATPKRRKAGAEYHACVQKISVGDNLVIQTSDGFIHHWQYQSIFDIGG